MTDWLGWFVPRWRRPEPTESLAPPAPVDLDQLDRLRAEGSRLDLPHPVRSFVRFKSETEAREAAQALAGEHVRTQLRGDADGGWTVTAIQRMVPTAGAITKLRETMTELADAYGGEYAGWTAPPVY